jgi:hypothetical protein
MSTDLIGKTIIDLEDRWFDARWQKMGEENVRLPGSDPNDPTKVYFCIHCCLLVCGSLRCAEFVSASVAYPYKRRLERIRT